jgi:hypothetical protein
MAGDLGFLTGLNMGRRETAQVAADWQQYAQGLNNQIASLSQQLAHERAYRAVNRADIAGIMSALSRLPPAIQEQVKSAMRQNYCDAFVQRAVELGLPHNIAVSESRLQLEGRSAVGR